MPYIPADQNHLEVACSLFQCLQAFSFRFTKSYTDGGDKAK
jgi:hypothetical protein